MNELNMHILESQRVSNPQIGLFKNRPKLSEIQTKTKEKSLPPLTHDIQDYLKLVSKSHKLMPDENYLKATEIVQSQIMNKENENILLSASSMSTYCEMIDASSIGYFRKRLKNSTSTQHLSKKLSLREIFKKAAQNSSKTKLLILQKLNENQNLNKNNSNIDGTFEFCYNARSCPSIKQDKVKSHNSQNIFYNESSLERDIRSRTTYDRYLKRNSLEAIDILLITCKNAIFIAILLLIIWPLNILLKLFWIFTKYTCLFSSNLNDVCLLIDDLSCKVLFYEKFIMNKLSLNYFL